jgi:flagellar capping protein FliD
MEVIREFVEAYNELMDNLNNMVSERRPRSGGSLFMPLTREQRAEMSESEIALWEEQGRTGLLGNDPHITRIITSLRSAVMSPVTLADGRTVTLASIGITTGSFFEENPGRLTINEDVLREAIINDPEMVEALFMHQTPYTTPPRFDGTRGSAETVNSWHERYMTAADIDPATGRTRTDRHGNIIRNAADLQRAISNTQGIGRRFEGIFTGAVHISSNEHLRGSLVRAAGTGGANSFVDNDSSLQRRMNRQDSAIALIQQRLQDAEERHFARFARLETSLARLSRQASVLGVEQ